MKTTKHVVMFSGGISSAYLAQKVINQYGRENTELFFTDTKWEDEDNYRFIREVSDYLGKDITWYVDGRTPEQVFWDKRFLGNYRVTPCSSELKMKQTVLYVERLRLAGVEPILYFGIGLKESSRAKRIAFMYSHHCIEPVASRFPLIDEDIDNTYLIRTIEHEWGIPVPRMYKLGFKHANCGGRCVKAGLSHYKNLFRVWPERFKAQVDMERRFRQEVNDYTLLKRDKMPFSLEDLEASIENQIPINIFETDEIPCTCVF